MKTRAATLIATVIALWSLQATAQQSLYKETADGWFIYKEAASCVAYADFPSGTMLRFSNRTDENRMYFSAYNGDWEHLRPLKGQTVTLSLKFGGLGRNYTTAAGIVENPDGRMGFSGADLSNQDIIIAMAGSVKMSIGLLYEGSKKEVMADNVALTGGTEAALQLAECSSKFF